MCWVAREPKKKKERKWGSAHCWSSAHSSESLEIDLTKKLSTHNHVSESLTSICAAQWMNSQHIVWSSGSYCDGQNKSTLFLPKVSKETTLFWKWKMWKFSYSFRIMAIFYFINWIVATETIEEGKLLKGENYDIISWDSIFNQITG